LGLIIGLVIGLSTFCMKVSSFGIPGAADNFRAARAYQRMPRRSRRPTGTLIPMAIATTLLPPSSCGSEGGEKGCHGACGEATDGG
jgi:hypothetical protein